MKKAFSIKVFAVFVLALALTMPTLAYADTIITDGTYNLQFNSGETFAVQNTVYPSIINFTVTAGTLNATMTLGTTDAEGVLEITPTTGGTVSISSNNVTGQIKINSIITTAYTFVAGETFTVTWMWTALPVVDIGDLGGIGGGDVDLLLTYLVEGDFLGFIVGCYTSRVGQFFWMFIVLMFTIPLALRTSITYVAIVWLILAGIFQAAMPMISPAAVLFLIMAITGLIYRVVTGARD